MSGNAEVPKRPARRQVDAPVTGREEVHPAGVVNIWTGRVLKEYRKPKESRRKEASAYRCHPAIDSGLTRGDSGGATYCCLYFARGICHHGHECNYLHRVPTAADEQRHRTDYSHDIFGRERGPDRFDGRKKGVGSYERDCKTLYVNYGGAGTLPTDQLRTIVTENFAEWGPVEHVYIVPNKTLAFVRYEWRSSAEFAKAAMHQQTLRGCDTTEILDVRWANDDPNPRSIARVQQEREDALRDAYVKAVNELPPDAKRARIQQLHLAATVRPGMAFSDYPDTDAQYGGAAAGSAGGYRHQYEGWDAFLYQQQQQELDEQEQGPVEGPSRRPDGDSSSAADEAARWEAWRQWQAQNPGGYYPPPAGAAAGDEYTRYLRPEDYYYLAYQQQEQEQQQPAAEGGAPPEGSRQEDEAAEQALGLIAGYGSDSGSEVDGA